jgi:hypothetical protein
MNERKDMSYQVVEELFKGADLELLSWWSKRRAAAAVKVQMQQEKREDSEIASGNLRQLKPNLRER